MNLKQAWNKELDTHSGDYGGSAVYDLYCAFKAGWLAKTRSNKDKLKQMGK